MIEIEQGLVADNSGPGGEKQSRSYRTGYRVPSPQGKVPTRHQIEFRTGILFRAFSMAHFRWGQYVVHSPDSHRLSDAEYEGLFLPRMYACLYRAQSRQSPALCSLYVPCPSSYSILHVFVYRVLCTYSVLLDQERVITDWSGHQWFSLLIGCP